ncbi:cutaneous T-cell lymphoma tumor antigen se70-2 [Aphelenchoides avenae]|nr:cutaneous T-cell lymphoma tumor antigen se70-2 [Aphelenchus avenae]
MIIDSEAALKAWIVEDISTLSDAEPEALAKYVLALLRKNLSEDELEKLCKEQLDVFLQNHTNNFVDSLFKCLRNKEYLQPKKGHASKSESPKESSSPSSGGETPKKTSPRAEERASSVPKPEPASSAHEAIESNATTRDPKRMKSETKASVEHVPSSRPVRRRISPPARAASPDARGERRGVSPDVRGDRRRRSRSPPRRRVDQSPPRKPDRGDRYTRRRSRSRSRSPLDRDRKDKREDRRRQRCRDFDEKGFCMRGDKCPYDHGPDPVVVEETSLEKMVKGVKTTNYPVYNPLNPPPPGVDFVASTSSEAYNPEAPALTTPSSVAQIDFSVPPPPLPHLAGGSAIMFPNPTQVGVVTVAPNVNPSYDTIPGDGHQHPMGGNVGPQMYHHRGGGFNRRGRGGRFNPTVRPPNVSCSLQVRNIPPELNKIATIDDHFSKFGTITNLQLNFDGAPGTALVTFKNRHEAVAAIKSTEPIFNNRFIKVFWHNPTQTTAPDTETTTTAPAITLAGPPAVEQVQTVHSAPPKRAAVTFGPRGAFSKTFGAPRTENEVLADKTIEEKSGDEAEAEPGKPIVGEPSKPKPVAAPSFNEKLSTLKQKKGALLQLNRRLTDLTTEQLNEIKQVLLKASSAKEANTKKKYMELVKALEKKKAETKAQMDDVLGKIAAIDKEMEETNTAAAAARVASANGRAAEKRKRRESAADQSSDDELSERKRTKNGKITFGHL